MSMSEYIKDIRSRIGNALLQVPAVSILTFDKEDRVLLVRHADGDWTSPGGMIEPYETPADAAVREMWEETGLHVRLTRIVGVFGGPVCSVTYANGDKISWVSTVFEAQPISGTLKPDGVESLEVKYFEPTAIPDSGCQPHVKEFLRMVYDQSSRVYFEPATWHPEEA